MTWTYTQNFDGLSTAALNGQDSWSGHSSYNVIDSGTILQGTKSVYSNNNAEVNIDRSVSSVSAGVVSVKLRKTETSSLMWWVQLYEGASYRGDAGMNTSGQIQVRGSTSETATTYSADTTYTVDLEFDASTDQLRCRVDGGSWTAWVSSSTTITSGIDTLRMSKQNGGTQGVYFDDIQNGASASGPANLKTLSTTAKASIKTISGTAIASVKTVSTTA